jgi:hypothetical protein
VSAVICAAIAAFIGQKALYAIGIGLFSLTWDYLQGARRRRAALAMD